MTSATIKLVVKPSATHTSDKKKPIVAVINNMGASAAYMIALHADKIYAGQYSLVGSVGAVLTGWDFSKAITRVDVSQRVYASGNLKAMLNLFLPMTAEADAKAKELAQQMGEQFGAELKARRQGKLKEGVNYTTGEIWSGKEAKELAVIDDIGTVDHGHQGFMGGEESRLLALETEDAVHRHLRRVGSQRSCRDRPR
jgi:protease-4